jgi:hypothetical protein
MTIALLLAQFLFSSDSLAAPTHHDLAGALVQIANANNEADGPFSHQVCFYDVPSPSGKSIEDKNHYRVLVMTRFSEGKPVVMARNFSVIVGGYWVADSIASLGSERMEKFTCPGKPSIVYKP